MAQTNTAELISFFEEAFSNDIYERELRLSACEADILKTTYPRITFDQISEYAQDKNWYKINIKPAL